MPWFIWVGAVAVYSAWAFRQTFRWWWEDAKPKYSRNRVRDGEDLFLCLVMSTILFSVCGPFYALANRNSGKYGEGAESLGNLIAGTGESRRTRKKKALEKRVKELERELQFHD